MCEIDPLLFEVAKSGDRDAFGELMRVLRPELRAFCLSRLGPGLRQHVDVEDIIQETSLKAYQSIDGIQWQGQKALFSWLCGIAINVIYAHSRRLLRIGSPTAEFADLEDFGSSPSRCLGREERFDRLEQSITKLTNEQQQVVRLTRIEGLTIREAAARMDRSEKTTYQLLWRALKKLREVFGETASLRLPNNRSLNQQSRND